MSTPVILPVNITCPDALSVNVEDRIPIAGIVAADDADAADMFRFSPVTPVE